MKTIYQGILFVALLAVAIYGVGGQEPTSGGFVLALLGMFAVMGLMAKSGMMAKPVSKEEYKKYYNNEGNY